MIWNKDPLYIFTHTYSWGVKHEDCKIIPILAYSTHIQIHHTFDGKFQNVSNEHYPIRHRKLKGLVHYWFKKQKKVNTNKFIILSYLSCALDFNMDFVKCRSKHFFSVADSSSKSILGICIFNFIPMPIFDSTTFTHLRLIVAHVIDLILAHIWSMLLDVFTSNSDEWIKFTPFVSYCSYNVLCLTFRRNLQVLIERKIVKAISKNNRGLTTPRKTDGNNTKDRTVVHAAWSCCSNQDHARPGARPCVWPCVGARPCTPSLRGLAIFRPFYIDLSSYFEGSLLRDSFENQLGLD